MVHRMPMRRHTMGERVVDPFAGDGGSKPPDVAELEAGARLRIRLSPGRLMADAAKVAAGAGLYAVRLHR
jgi:hypothetical protein